jgi:hypothetical protein
VRAWPLVVSACGRLAFEPHGDALVADSDSATGVDAPIACTWSAFSTPAALPGPVQSPVDDWCPTPTVGGLQIFMHTYRASTHGQLFSATRTATNLPFGMATNVAELTTGTSQQFDPTLTGDGLDIIYSDDMAGPFHLYEAMRSSATGKFGTPVALAAINSTTTDWDAFLSDDGLRLMFTSQRNSGQYEIFETKRVAIGSQFDTPVLHSELTVAGTAQSSPTLSADWLDIYFASNRPGGPGKYDMYTAHRPALDQPFGVVTLVPELSSPLDDLCARLAVDGSTIYLNYSANTSGGNADLDSATRTCQ